VPCIVRENHLHRIAATGSESTVGSARMMLNGSQAGLSPEQRGVSFTLAAVHSCMQVWQNCTPLVLLGPAPMNKASVFKVS
jgi:hypothetical protein